MPKMKTVKGPIPPPMLRFVAAVQDSNGKDILIRASPITYPPTDDQISAFLRSLGYTPTEWTINERETPTERFNYLWLAAYSAYDSAEEAAIAWTEALEETCGDDEEDDQP